LAGLAQFRERQIAIFTIIQSFDAALSQLTTALNNFLLYENVRKGKLKNNEGVVKYAINRLRCIALD
jgi:hypothetical protein